MRVPGVAMLLALPLFLILSAAVGIGAVVKERDKPKQRRLTFLFAGTVYGSIVTALHFLDVLGLAVAALLLVPLAWFPVSMAFHDTWKRLLIVSLLASAALFAYTADHFEYILQPWGFVSGSVLGLFIVEPWHVTAAYSGMALSLLGAVLVAWKYPGSRPVVTSGTSSPPAS